MPYKTELDWNKVQAKAQEMCHARMREHLDEMTVTSTRFFKRLKEAFFGKNVLSHHKTRLAAKTAGLVWGVCRHAVPGGEVAEKVRSAVATAGNVLLSQQIESGKTVPTWAKDLFDVDTSFIHSKMAIFYDELESILLWQEQFEAHVQAPVTSDEQLAKLIHAFEKLKFHYQKACAVTAELNRIYHDEYRKLENYAQRWDLTQREHSDIYRVQTQIVTKLLFSPEVHNRHCRPDTCFFGKEPLDILSLYTSVLRLTPVDAQALGIVKGTFLTKANLQHLGEKESFFAGQTQAVSPASLQAQGRRPALGTALCSSDDWKSFSWILGFRGTETQGIDNAYQAYVTRATHDIRDIQTPDIGELNTSLAARATLKADLEDRVTALATLRRETRTFISAKSASASSKRRPYVLMLDALAALEQDALARCCSELEAE